MRLRMNRLKQIDRFVDSAKADSLEPKQALSDWLKGETERSAAFDELKQLTANATRQERQIIKQRIRLTLGHLPKYFRPGNADCSVEMAEYLAKVFEGSLTIDVLDFWALYYPALLPMDTSFLRSLVFWLEAWRCTSYLNYVLRAKRTAEFMLSPPTPEDLATLKFPDHGFRVAFVDCPLPMWTISKRGFEPLLSLEAECRDRKFVVRAYTASEAIIFVDDWDKPEAIFDWAKPCCFEDSEHRTLLALRALIYNLVERSSDDSLMYSLNERAKAKPFRQSDLGKKLSHPRITNHLYSEEFLKEPSLEDARELASMRSLSVR